MENQRRLFEDNWLSTYMNSSSDVFIHSTRPPVNSSFLFGATFASPTNAFGPLSYTQMRLLSNSIPAKEKPQTFEESQDIGKKAEHCQSFR